MDIVPDSNLVGSAKQHTRVDADIVADVNQVWAQNPSQSINNDLLTPFCETLQEKRAFVCDCSKFTAKLGQQSTLMRRTSRFADWHLWPPQQFTLRIQDNSRMAEASKIIRI